MKTNSEIAHIWAHQLPQPKTQGNLFFNGQTIYSYGYHFPIAKLLDENTVLFTTRSYSNSTAKQISIVHRAASHLNKIYCYNPDYSHPDNIQQFIKKIMSEATNLVKAKKPEKYLLKIEQIKDSLSAYLGYFKLSLTKLEKKQIEIRGLESYLLIIEKQKAKEIEKKKKNLILGEPLYLRGVQNFRNNESVNFSDKEYKLAMGYCNSIGDPIIFKIVGDQIISSKGIKVPIAVAKTCINLFLNGRINVGDKILNYIVNLVDRDQIKIGCHNIPRSEIENLKTALN